MSVEAAEALLAKIADSGQWPMPDEAPILDRLNTWAALRESDKERLQRAASWNDPRRAYRVDPLPGRIADAWASYLFGEDPRVTPANEGDVAFLGSMLEVNDFPSELERAAGISVSEGEVWSRIYVDELASPHPLLDWVSRRNVIPLWVGPRLAAVAVHTELRRPAGDPKRNVWRHFEVHAPGVIVNALYLGTDTKLGDRRDLEHHASTAGIEPIWVHGLPGMLVERIPNRLRGNTRLGVSDYAGILDTLLDLNEAAAVGAANVRLTARKRAVIAASALRSGDGIGDTWPAPEENGRDSAPRARFDPSEEVFVEDPLDSELGKQAASPFRILEYSFDASPLIAWKQDLVNTALSRVGLVAQFAGTGGGAEGYAISGTALRLKLIPTDKGGRAKARYYDDKLPKILATMARLDTGGPDTVGGFGRGWADPVTPPSVVRRPGLPADEVEEAQRHSTLVNSGLLSVETSLKLRFPDWDEARIAEEVARIREDKSAAAPAGAFGGVPTIA